MLDNLKLGYGGTKEEMQRLLDDASKLSGIKYDISSDVYKRQLCLYQHISTSFKHFGDCLNCSRLSPAESVYNIFQPEV